MKTTSLEQLTDQHVGKKGTPERFAFDQMLRLDLISLAIKRARKKRNLTQEQLGRLIGVQKAQISKLENGLTDVRLATILKVFDALDARISFSVDLNQKRSNRKQAI